MSTEELKIFNQNKQKHLRQALRNNMPMAEVILWSKIKNKSLNNFKFRRQFSVGQYVLDFYCPMAKLGVEVDGDSHYIDETNQDLTRRKNIESFGIRIIRFTNKDISENIEGVLEKIIENLNKPPLTPP